MLAMARLRTSLGLTKIDFSLRNLFDRQSFLSFRGSLFETIKWIVLGKIPFSPIIQDSRDRQFSIRKDARSLKINPRITKPVSPFESSLFHDFEKKKKKKEGKVRVSTMEAKTAKQKCRLVEGACTQVGI